MFDEMSEIGHIGIGTHVYVPAGGLALAGDILGFTNWALDVPPKFFRTKSRVQLCVRDAWKRRLLGGSLK